MRNLYAPIVILLAMCFSPFVLHAQDTPWLEVGSEWTYQNGHIGGPEHFQFKYGISEETVFAGQECVKMEKLDFGTGGMWCRTLIDPYYFYESNDSLYFASELDSTFRLVADFGALVGDSWLYVLPAPFFDDEIIVVDTFLITVTNVEIINIDGHNLRKLSLDLEWLGNSDPSLEFFQELYFDVHMIEVIGGTGFFAPLGRYSTCDAETTVRFQCFDSENLNYINPFYPACDFIVGIEENDLAETLNVFPNPASNWLQLESNSSEPILSVDIYSLSGQLISTYPARQTNNETIDVSGLSPGMYLIHAHSVSGWHTAKVVKE